MAEPAKNYQLKGQNPGVPPGYVRHFRIFLASPGDVAAERKIAMEVVGQLPYDPQFRGKVSLEHVAWDNPGTGTLMRATISPQEAIARGQGEPADCDIVIVIFWARLGRPLPDPPYHHEAADRAYHSGTEWEYENAMEGFRCNHRPEVIVYRRTEDPLFSPRDPEFKSKWEQWNLVEDFFGRFSEPNTGAIRHGCNFYTGPDDFRRQFTQHLRELVEELLQAPESPPLVPSPSPELWRGSPFPGLRAFTNCDAPIFFGRGRETDDLVERINRNRFVAVVGASGSGKSSLVWAGLIPALKDNSIRTERVASSDWLWLRMTPGGSKENPDNPFLALAEELAADEELKPQLGRKPHAIAVELAANPEALGRLIPQALSGRPASAELLLFIDQFEELVTVVAPCYRAPFVQMLSRAIAAGRFRAVATLRADFYHQMIPVAPALVELLQNGSYPLGAPDEVSLHEMIVRPAERAGLQFEGELARRIVSDTGNEPGALALMAYLLDELYQRQLQKADGRLSRRDYGELGGVEGAIGKQAEQAFTKLSPDAQKVLPQVFRRLVEVDESGIATRRRAPLEEIERTAPHAAEELVREFTKARLLVTDAPATGTLRKNPTVEVAHEALLRSWDRLATWIQEKRDDWRLLRQVKQAAAEWDRKARQDAYRWPDERLKPVYQTIQRLELGEEGEFSATEREFIRPESERLLEEIQNADTPHLRRSEIGERLARIGDPRPGVGLRPDGLPDIDWCLVEIPGKSSVKVEIEDVGEVKVNLPFRIARYPITFAQFQAFIDASDGYSNREINWFEGLAESDGDKRLVEQRFKFPNHPRETVNWYQAMAFCRWLSWRLEGKSSKFDLRNPFTWPVRLPTEAEWQFAAGGPSATTFPWGKDWDGRFTNIYESGLGRTTAVGMYPAGAALCGALDLSGNVEEWTLTDYDTGKSADITNKERRVVRGSSWDVIQNYFRAACRHGYGPGYRFFNFGFRVVGVVPSR